jgi:hypothetical protein
MEIMMVNLSTHLNATNDAKKIVKNVNEIMVTSLKFKLSLISTDIAKYTKYGTLIDHSTH